MGQGNNSIRFLELWEETLYSFGLLSDGPIKNIRIFYLCRADR